MEIEVDVWLRGENHATTHKILGPSTEPGAWTDDDVRLVLTAMLRAMSRQKNPASDDPDISLKGLSWIVNPYEEGGVVIALEITLGAAVAGPFAIPKGDLERLIARALESGRSAGARVH